MANELKGLIDITTGAERADANVNGIFDLTADEVSQVANIDTVTVTNTQWAYLGLLDQNLNQASLPSFAGITLAGQAITAVSTGTSNNDKFVTQGYVDDGVFGGLWQRIGTDLSPINPGYDTYLVDDPIVGTAQSIYLPGHIYVAPYDGSDISYLQARRSDNSGSTRWMIRTFDIGVMVNAISIYPDGAVGIGVPSPNQKLEVGGNILLLDYLTFGGISGGVGGYGVRHNSGIIETKNSGGTWKPIPEAITSSCKVRLSVQQDEVGAGTAVVAFNTEDWDKLNNFNTTTYTFTATVAGRYHVIGQLKVNTNSPPSSISARIHKNGVNIFESYGNQYSSSVYDQTILYQGVLDLAVNDTVQIILVMPDIITYRIRVDADKTWLAITRIQ